MIHARGLIQTLILSYHPIIVIETVEEERVARLLQRAAEEMGMPLFEWSVARGISRKPGTFNAPWDVGESSASLEETKEPEAMLKYIHETQKSIFWLKDLGEHLGDASVARQFREVAQKFSKHRAVMVVTGESVRLPGAVAGDAAHCELKLPDREELARVVKEVGRTLSEKNRVRVELDDRAEQSLVSALCGTALKQARQVLAYAALEDGQLCDGDVPRILKRKSQMIHEASILEYHPVENLSVAMGGFAGLKRWLTRAKVGFSGAEMEQAIIAALYEALAQGRSLDTALLVSQIKEMIPLSVSRWEDLQRLRAIAKERFLSAG